MQYYNAWGLRSKLMACMETGNTVLACTILREVEDTDPVLAKQLHDEVQDAYGELDYS